ncbi:maleylpyruvate isomerase family mycothiol-dependent enzyme [Rhodococcoides yunnanense]|uniref:maleylpyruvate isomerase family mycothiol-dependent enzyme n=1 Tax=Rhodococcoides yunnanense TaxID=278209 RepID=UPI000932BE7F|nr:maleylpyruvate isomerase family mycothiol-dependent enzyme [Rhodococcus yunnanensis]
MDVSTLHTVTENLAEWLSEVTQGDLRQPTPVPAQDVGDLYLHLIDRNIVIAAGLTHEAVPKRLQSDPIRRSALDTPIYLHGGGLEERYRQTARRMESAFASVSSAELRYCIDGVDLEAGAVYEKQISETVIHTWDLGQAMGFDYRPDDEVARRILTTLQEPPLADADAVWACALRISGRM